MIQFFRTHTLIVLYSLVFFILMFGVYLTSSGEHLGNLALYYISFLVFYIGFYLLRNKVKIIDRIINLKIFKTKINPFYLLIPVFAFILVHFILMGGSPTLKAMSLDTWQEVAKLRESLAENIHPIIGYGSSIILKAVLPFFLLFFLIKENKLWYWIVLIVGAFYVFSMMQKSFIIGFILPSAVYAFAKRKFLIGGKHVFLMVLVVIGLSKIANPNVAGKNPDLIADNSTDIGVADSSLIDTAKTYVDTSSLTNFDVTVKEADKTPSKLSTLIQGIKRRIFVVPGKIVSGWFDHIPENKPFLNGDGYRIVAKMKGNPHRSYASELYPLMNPKYAAQGFKGTVNTASFMYDYANFGKWGLVLSSFILALIFLVIEALFRDDFVIKLSLNLYPLLFLTSTAITTLMFSGGWSFFILFYFLFLFRKNED